MPGGPPNPGQFAPPMHSQMHPNQMMLPVGAPGMPGGMPGMHYGPHGPLPPLGPMPPGAERGEHGMPQMAPGQQPPPQMSGHLMGQHHHGPPGSMGILQMGPHQQIHPGAMPPHGHPHHLHHPQQGPIAMHRSTLQTEFRIFELNKRLQQRTDDLDGQWWEAFATDFFDDEATITITVRLEDGPKNFTIGRTLIPRYFRSLFDGGCDEIYFTLRHTREAFHNSILTLNSDCANMIMNVSRPLPSTVVVEAQFTLGFILDEFMRIRSWTFQIRSHRELILRSMLGIQEPALFEQVCKNISRSGIMSNTLHFLRLCVILEPMQELMSRQKFQNLSPRECLRTTLMHRWKRMTAMQNVAPKPESNRQPSKRRKRKGSAANSEAGASRATKRKQSPVQMPPQGLSQPGDIMIVGEPTLMGGEFGEDDERIITRLENSQYDPAAAALAAQQQMAGMGVSSASGGLPLFSRPPAFPPAFHPGGGQSPMMYAPGPPYASSPTLKPQQSPHYGHPNSVPAPLYGSGVGGPIMPASVPPQHGARIISPMTNAGGGGGGLGGNPGTPGGGNAPMMFAPPPSIAGSEPCGATAGGGQQAQPPRSSSADGPAFPPPLPPPHSYQPLLQSSNSDPRATPPLTLIQQQMNGPFQGPKSPPLNSPGTSNLRFPPPLMYFGGMNRNPPETMMSGCTTASRLQQCGQQPSDVGPDSRSETPNPNGYPGDQASSGKQQAFSSIPPATSSADSSSSCPASTSQRTPASSNGSAAAGGGISVSAPLTSGPQAPFSSEPESSTITLSKTPTLAQSNEEPDNAAAPLPKVLNRENNEMVDHAVTAISTIINNSDFSDDGSAMAVKLPDPEMLDGAAALATGDS